MSSCFSAVDHKSTDPSLRQADQRGRGVSPTWPAVPLAGTGTLSWDRASFEASVVEAARCRWGVPGTFSIN